MQAMQVVPQFAMQGQAMQAMQAVPQFDQAVPVYAVPLPVAPAAQVILIPLMLCLCPLRLPLRWFC